MAKYYYREKNRNYKLFAKLFCALIVVVGGLAFAYTFFPLISWQIYFAPAFASQKIATPIPQTNVINPTNITSLINTATDVKTDYSNAYNWYPGYKRGEKTVANYTISIPKIDIKDAVVTNQDADLLKHLVQFNNDTEPPKAGNSIIFGHSSLPQLYDPNNYKTIFSNAYKLRVGDLIIVKNKGETYNYKVETVTVVDPGDTSILAQNFSDSFLTIVTCTPPGTIWKRLIVKARLQEF
jgi:sortase A